jgi:hypothetical protein
MTDNTDTYDFVGYTDSETLPGHTKEYTEGFTEEMVIPYRTEELNPYLSDPQAQYNKLLRTQQKLRNKKK